MVVQHHYFCKPQGTPHTDPIPDIFLRILLLHHTADLGKLRPAGHIRPFPHPCSTRIRPIINDINPTNICHFLLLFWNWNYIAVLHYFWRWIICNEIHWLQNCVFLLDVYTTLLHKPTQVSYRMLYSYVYQCQLFKIFNLGNFTVVQSWSPSNTV